MPTAKACIRCHGKKIRCSGYPNCRSCDKAGINCQPHTRQRKGDALAELRYYRQRTLWLEDEIYKRFNTQCKDVTTGAPLRPANETPIGDELQDRPIYGNPAIASSATLPELQDLSAPASQTTDIGMLALNATGEMKYLGPSSGAFFAAYTSALVQSCISENNLRTSTPYSQHTSSNSKNDTESISCFSRLSSSDVDFFYQSYKMWILPLYPVLSSAALELLVSRYIEDTDAEQTGISQSYEKLTDTMIFYLVMALGAVNASNTLKQMRKQLGQEQTLDLRIPQPSPMSLCTQALQLMNDNLKKLYPTVKSIQVIVLVSIYSSYGCIGSSQWHLAGIAMRMAVEMGLHCTPNTSNLSESVKDEKNRLFWTIYTIETSLAYNLGRPPSIGEEHITAEIPKPSHDNLLSLHHLRHRQIQSRIVTQIYGINSRTRNQSTEQTQILISSVQEELDEWRANMPVSRCSEGPPPYPHSYWERLYHGTTFVLHRPSPLCPSPPAQSLERCIRSAGSYIDDMLKILKASEVPLSWMLAQGVLFAGLTMLVTARTRLPELLCYAHTSFLLVDLHTWAKNCSICLTIMNERLREDLLTKLDSQFDSFANDTLRIISTKITSQTTCDFLGEAMLSANSNLDVTILPGSEQILTTNTSSFFMDPTEDWDNLDIIKELMGHDLTQTFWDTLPHEFEMGGSLS